MKWIILVIAGLLEIGWVIGLRYTQGFSRPVPTVFTVAAMVASLALLGIALKQLPVGTAYAIWVGIGAAGTAVLGMWLFDETVSVMKLASLGLIVAGVAGLKLSS
jgi:quaternary ammonium compound-resistance protein SugE